MSLGNFIKRLQDIMRNDAGINGDAQRIEQITWILFLKIYDAKESEWEIDDDNYRSIMPTNLRYSNWAIDNKDGAFCSSKKYHYHPTNHYSPSHRKKGI